MKAEGNAAAAKAVAAWVGAAVFSAWVAFFLQDYWGRFPRGLLTDDAYFYVKIAWNLGVHGASTFDGLHVTDGYHFLWAWILAGVSAITERFTSAPSAHLSAMFWVYLMLCWVIAFRYAHGVAEVLLLFAMGLLFKALMETTLLALLLLMLWEHEYLAPARPEGRRWKGRPLLLILIPLVRVDAVLILGVTALSRLWAPRVPLRGRLRACVNDAAWIGAGLVLQLGLHFALFREWATVSMRIKGSGSTGFAQRLLENLAGFYGANLLSTLIFLLLAGLAAWAGLRQPRAERARHLVVLAAPAFFVLFHLVFNSTISYWYFVPAALPYAAYILRWGPPIRSLPGFTGRAALLMLAVLVASKWIVDTKVRGPQIRESRAFVAEVRRLVPPGEPVFQIDASGWVGWFSGLPIVNGDGLVNDHAYARRLAAGTLGGYLHEQGIHYVIQNVYPGEGMLLDLQGLSVPMDSVETLIAPPPGFPRLTAFGLYRLRSP